MMRTWPGNGIPTLSAVVRGPFASARYTSAPSDTIRCFAILTLERQKKQSLATLAQPILGNYVQLRVVASLAVAFADNHNSSEKRLRIFDIFGHRH